MRMFNYVSPQMLEYLAVPVHLSVGLSRPHWVGMGRMYHVVLAFSRNNVQNVPVLHTLSG